MALSHHPHLKLQEGEQGPARDGWPRKTERKHGVLGEQPQLGSPQEAQEGAHRGQHPEKGAQPQPSPLGFAGGGGDMLRLWPQQKSALVPPQAREPNSLSFGVSNREIEQLTESS